ncbi:MAG: response regulator [Mariprofundus sp.]|nr:response regulator [Mariprofundus sp.]
MQLSLPVKFASMSFIITLFGVLGVAMMAYLESDQLLQQEAINSLSMQVQEESDLLSSNAEMVRSDVAFLSQSQPVQSLAQRFAKGLSIQTDIRHLEKLFSNLLVQHKMYSQVRLIGVANDGHELARVARLAHGITVIANSKLMKKNKWDYFQASIKLKPGKFRFSDITLNREHGVITLPPQPVLRVSTALFDDNGAIYGILLINVDFNLLAQSVLTHVEHSDDQQHYFIANAHGDYIVHPDAHKNMAFELGQQTTLQQDFHIEGALLQNNKHTSNSIDQYLLDDSGLILILGKVLLDQSHPDRFLHIGGTFTLHQLRQQSLALRDRMLWLTLLLAIFLGVVTYYWARYLTRPVRKMIDVAVKISEGEKDVPMPNTGKDEIGLLSHALQQMVTHLRESRQKTEALNVALEVKVNNRTAQLAKLAEELESQNNQLEKALINAEQAALAKSQFLATMSHEIRTPLNGVLGLTELVLSSKMYPAQRKRMEVIQSSGKALLTILNDILDFSKIEAGQMEVKAIEFNPNHVIEDVVQLFSSQVNQNENTLELIARGIPVVKNVVIGDSDRLHQVMLNLVSNAIKFTQQGEVLIAVDLQSENDLQVIVRFQVADTGRGISVKDQARLFEEFTQADGTDTRKHGGTGLGLAIVKRLVSMMGGDIAVKSEIGKGSCFYFDLKLKKSAPIAAGPHQYSDEFSQWRALVVDDNATNRDILHGLLAGWGASCDMCSSGEDTKQRLLEMTRQSTAYDMIFIDHQMQGMDGMTLARVIKETPELSDLKVIMTTSLDFTFDNALRQKYGLNGFMRKPIYVHSLCETVLDVMGVRKRIIRSDTEIGVIHRDERILLAEDNAVNEQVAVGMLKNQGFANVDVAHNGLEALTLYAEHEYDLILMDVQMPDLDGIAATREIRELEQFSENAQQIPIIALTAHALDTNMQRTRDAGMNAHLTKPLTGKALKGVMAEWLPSQTQADSQPNSVTIEEEQHNEEPALAVVDEAALRQLQTDMGFGIGMILDTYLSELPKQIEAIEAAIAAADGDTLRRNGHRLKGASRSIAAATLGELCFQLEQFGQNNDIKAAARLFNEFKQAAEQVQEALAANWLSEIR